MEKAGCPTNGTKPETYSLPEVHKWLLRRETDKHASGLTETRRKKTDAEWRYKEVALLERSGDLIPLGEYAQQVNQAFRMCRDLLLKMP